MSRALLISCVGLALSFGACGGKESTNEGASGSGGSPSGDGDSGEGGASESVCGDGEVGVGEACDDGNVEDGDGCSATCLPELEEEPLEVECGNGVIDVAEECDDGNIEGGDGCDSMCLVEDLYRCAGQPSMCVAGPTPCGNGQIDFTEQCDDGNEEDGDGCSSACLREPDPCGNGTVDEGETCDDGDGRDSGNGCDAQCVYYGFCGNGLVESYGETCDDGINDGAYGSCLADCSGFAARCGDGQLDDGAGETCDDGDEIDSDNGCDSDCTRNDECGNGSVESLYEGCDDGNETDDGNGCDEACQPNNVCGNGVHEDLVEECDLGAESNDGAYGGCNADCTLADYCGDGIVNGSEGCDDGNATDDGNGCSATCQPNNSCGDGVHEPAVEECDLGTVNNDGSYEGCNSDCTLSGFCGDGLMTHEEACDDGNTDENHNGCDVDCSCNGEICGGVCIAVHADNNNCGACGNVCGAGEECVGGVCCEDCNLLRGIYNGSAAPGSAHVEAIVATGEVTPYSLTLPDDLHAPCDDSWEPTGALCDEGGPGFTDSRRYSYREDEDAGSTWNDETTNGEGILIVDLGAERTLKTFAVWQMFSDGTTDEVRVLIHPETGEEVPAWDDPGWAEAVDWWGIGPGVVLEHQDGHVVGDPSTVVLQEAVRSRYLRIEADSNDEYIELRAIKAWSN